jgi:hypothetical protein
LAEQIIEIFEFFSPARIYHPIPIASHTKNVGNRLRISTKQLHVMNKIKKLFTLAVFVSLSGTAYSDNFHKNTAQPETTNIKKNVRNTEGLDLLTNYDRDLWEGPAGWSDKQWKWKKRLRWNKKCDYVGEIEIHSVSKNQQLIQVMCVPGAY